MSERLESEVQVNSPVIAEKASVSQRAESEELIGASTLPQEVQQLIDRMMQGTEPLDRPLRQNEVMKFGPPHINMCMLRATGMKVREVAETGGWGYQHTYQTMMHPYAKKLVRVLTNVTGGKVFDIRERIEEYAGEMLDYTFALAMQETDLKVVKDITFGMLDRAGFAPKGESSGKDQKSSESMNADQSTLQRLAKAMEGSAMVNREVMPTWTPRRPPEEQFEQGEGSAESAAKQDGGPASGNGSSTITSSLIPARRSA